MATGLTLTNLRGAGGPRLAVKTARGVLDAVEAGRLLRKKVPRSSMALSERQHET